MPNLLSLPFFRLKRVKNITLISVVFILGILLCTFETLPFAFTGSGKSPEEKIEKLCYELTGERAYVSTNNDAGGALAGVVVILNGGDNANLKLELTKMLSTLYALPSTRIYVSSNQAY